MFLSFRCFPAIARRIEVNEAQKVKTDTFAIHVSEEKESWLHSQKISLFLFCKGKGERKYDGKGLGLMLKLACHFLLRTTFVQYYELILLMRVTALVSGNYTITY